MDQQEVDLSSMMRLGTEYLDAFLEKLSGLPPHGSCSFLSMYNRGQLQFPRHSTNWVVKAESTT